VVRNKAINHEHTSVVLTVGLSASPFPFILKHVGPMRRPYPWTSKHADGRPLSMTSRIGLELVEALGSFPMTSRIPTSSGW